jgi:hypothetical protein
MSLPSGIVFVSNDHLPDQIRDTIITQLYITSTLDGYEYDDIINNNPDFPRQVKNTNQRIMVIRSFTELESRDTADVAILVTNGMAFIENNKFGPPGYTYRIPELTWGKLFVYALGY